ncbi:MAG: NAD-dependent epimerase/dehydratase family protein [Candidatus Methanomethylicia archaeon]
MVVMVTGGSGFIGSHIVDKLLEKGYDVRVFDLIKPHRDEVEWFKGDLLNKEDLLKACKDVEYIFHLGAIADVNVALSRPELCVQVNDVGTLNVLQAAQSLEVERVLLASTTWVYGKTEGVVTEETPIPLPDHIYTATKIAQEYLLISWNKHYGLPYTILRYDIPYGPRMRSNMAIAVFVRRAIKNEPLIIFGDGNQGRCFIYVEDLAEGNVAALNKNAENQIINLAGREFITINSVVRELKKIFNNITVEYKPARPGDFKGAIISIEKARKLLKWEPRTTLTEGLQKYIEWIKKKF